jgi:predicted DNA-binding protein
MAETVTLQIPEQLHQRLVNTAQATGRPLEAVILHAIAVGSPPAWDDVPEEYQPALAALERLEDAALWQIARGQKPLAEVTRYDELLDQNQERALSEAERLELLRLRQEAEQFMLRKAHAASILKWRGHQVAAA